MRHYAPRRLGTRRTAPPDHRPAGPRPRAGVDLLMSGDVRRMSRHPPAAEKHAALGRCLECARRGTASARAHVSVRGAPCPSGRSWRGCWVCVIWILRGSGPRSASYVLGPRTGGGRACGPGAGGAVPWVARMSGDWQGRGLMWARSVVRACGGGGVSCRSFVPGISQLTKNALQDRTSKAQRAAQSAMDTAYMRTRVALRRVPARELDEPDILRADVRLAELRAPARVRVCVTAFGCAWCAFAAEDASTARFLRYHAKIGGSWFG